MKKLLSLVALVFALGSCTEDVKFNNQAVFQGVKDNLFWKGTDAKAEREGSYLTVSAATLLEHMALTFPTPVHNVDPKNSTTFVTYSLGTSLNSIAEYSFVNDLGDEFFYHTAIGVGDGEVVVSEFDGVYISGTFRFNAINEDPESEANESVNVQHGTFYKVPVVQAVAQ